MVNYIEGKNPFRLAGPPKWFLQRLWDFDSSLRIIPSVTDFVYRLAQVGMINDRVKVVQDAMKMHGDSRQMARYGLIPVTTIISTVNWSNPLIFHDLAQRAPWRMGGAEKYEKLILEKEDRQKAALDAT